MNFTEHPKFSLGKIVATPLAIMALKRSGNCADLYLAKHQSGDWGDICEEDKLINDTAITHESDFEQQQRVLSSYMTKNKEIIWIITEWDRSVTTILTPDEY
jgi:hypothetical protein